MKAWLPISVLVYLAPSLYGAYAYQATVTIPAAVSSLSNFTVVFTGNNTLFKSVAGGGAIQSTSTRVGITVPNDLVLSTTSCASPTVGTYTWGFEDGGTTDGSPIIWALIPSYPASAATTIYVCIGNPAVTTYQGGAVGAEFDGNTAGVWHLPPGSGTLNASDFSSYANSTSNNGATAASGKIGGGIAVNGTTAVDVPYSATIAPSTMTLSMWFKRSGAQGMYARSLSRGTDQNGAPYGTYFVNFNGSDSTSISFGVGLMDSTTLGWSAPTGAVADATWTHIAFSYDGNTFSPYFNGTAETAATGSSAIYSDYHDYHLSIGSDVSYGNGDTNGLVGFIDEVRLDSTVRSAAWIATAYANQSSPPVLTITPSSSFVANQSVIVIQ